jgi:hypothetical protein
MIEQLNAMTNQEKFDYMKKWVENEEIMHKKIFSCAHKNLMSYLGNDDFFCIQTKLIDYGELYELYIENQKTKKDRLIIVFDKKLKVVKSNVDAVEVGWSWVSNA